MADNWIKVRTVLPTDGRLRIASRKCHVLPVTVFGALVTLWCLADSHANEFGVLVGYTCDDIDTHVGVPGFCASLPADWIDTSGDFVKLPEYQEHNGTTGKSRAQDSKRQQRHRDATNPSRSKRDNSVTREEKRREEKSKEKETTLPAWIVSLEGEAPVAPDDPLFGWASKQGIPGDWIALAYAAFEDRYAENGKTYADWRAAFRNHVKRGWLDIWRVDNRSGGFVLTTAGEQYRREVQA